MSFLIFFGSDQYSAVVLSKLIESNKLSILSVVTDRGKPKGRTQLAEPNPVEKLAIMHNLKVLYYPSNNEEMNKFTSSLLHLFADSTPTGLCASFDHLLPSPIIEVFHGRLYNLHPSLLPQYRNVSPVQYAIALGDKTTGITLFRISSGIDNGEIIAQIAEPIHENDTTPSLTKRLFEKGADMFLNYHPGSKSVLRARVGNDPLIFTHRLTRDSGFVEWPVVQKLLANQPIASTETKNELLQLRLHKIETQHLKIGNWQLVISDLVRSLYPWPSVWTIASTKKGDLRISLLPGEKVLIAGKPKPIARNDFIKYYVNTKE